MLLQRIAQIRDHFDLVYVPLAQSEKLQILYGYYQLMSIQSVHCESSTNFFCLPSCALGTAPDTTISSCVNRSAQQDETTVIT